MIKTYYVCPICLLNYPILRSCLHSLGDVIWYNRRTLTHDSYKYDTELITVRIHV